MLTDEHCKKLLLHFNLVFEPTKQLKVYAALREAYKQGRQCDLMKTTWTTSKPKGEKS